MLKKSLIVIVALGLLSVTATAAPPPLDYEEVPVVMVVNQYATISFVPGQIQLFETGPDPNVWRGYTTATVMNNCQVMVTATIDPYLPDIGGTLDCLVEGDITGFDNNQLSGIYLDPYPAGFSFKVWAAVTDPNPLARPWNPLAQRVATVHVTLTAI